MSQETKPALIGYKIKTDIPLIICRPKYISVKILKYVFIINNS